MTSAENRAHLADGFLKAIVARYRDTVLGRQELEGELIEDLPDALWQRSMFRADDGRRPERIVVAVDPPASGGAKSDACGIVVAGRVGASLTYPDRERGYLTGTMTAIGIGDGVASARATGLVLDVSGARATAERALAVADGETLEFSVPPSMAALEVGDALEAVDGTRFEVTEIRDGLARKIAAREIVEAPVAGVLSDRAVGTSAVPAPESVPLVEVLHLPAEPADAAHSRLVLAAWASPWPGRVSVVDETTGAEVVEATRAAWLGELVDPLVAGHNRYWDRRTAVQVRLFAGHLASATEDAVLAGTNRIAVEMDAGAREVIGFAEAELVSAGVYELSVLLRGQQGTDHAIGVAAVGNRVVVLNDRVVTTAVPTEWLGDSLGLRVYAGVADAVGVELPVEVRTAPALPLAPVHLQAERSARVGGCDAALGAAEPG